jgi:hypothetical protein
VLAGLMWLGVGRAFAQEQPRPSRVVIARVAGDESIVIRLRAELSSYRFRVIELAASARRSALLSELAEEREAQAALRAKPEAMAVELWVRAGATGTRTTQELVTAGPSHDPEVLALRVTEAMRARGLTLPPLTAAGPKLPEISSVADSSKRAGAAGASALAPEPTDIEPAEPTTLPPAPPSTAIPVKPEAKATEVEPERPNPEPPKPKPPVPERKPLDPPASSEPERPRPAEKNAEKPDENTKPEPEPEVATEIEPQAEAPSQLTLRDALLYVEVGPSGVWSPGANSVGAALDLLISLRFRPDPTSSISLVGLIPLLKSNLTTEDGASIDVRTYGIGGFGDLHWPLGRVELSAGLGGLALLSSVMVISAPGSLVYRPDYPTQRLAALLGRVGVNVALTRDLRVSGSIMAGLTVRELQVNRPPTDQTAAATDTESTPLATWGKPLFFGTLSVELALPWDR